jgi:hypothetical protein
VQVWYDELMRPDVSGAHWAKFGCVSLVAQVCQGPDQVKQQCSSTRGCAGFTHNGRCGYLKATVSSSKGRDGWTLFALKQ